MATRATIKRKKKKFKDYHLLFIGYEDYLDYLIENKIRLDIRYSFETFNNFLKENILSDISERRTKNFIENIEDFKDCYKRKESENYKDWWDKIYIGKAKLDSNSYYLNINQYKKEIIKLFLRFLKFKGVKY